MRINFRHLKNITYLNFIILAFSSFIIPIYVCDTNRHNLLFAASEIPLILLLFFLGIKKGGRRNKIFPIVLFLYFLVYLYYDIVYLKCYWPLFFKTASFMLLWYFDSQELIFRQNRDVLYSELTDTILSIFSFTVILSLIANIVGVDAIFLDFNAFHIRSARSGVFLDERLTWVFLHKSTYGLLLVLALTLLMKRKEFYVRKMWICIYFLAAIRINSMVSIVCMCGVLFAYYVETRSINKKTLIKMFIAFFVGLLLTGIIYYIVALGRNISSLGDRSYIWAIYADSLARYPHGMGKKFFTDTFWLAAGGRFINNFHNVLFNEMIHYSIPVGILYFVLIMYYPVNFIKTNPAKIKNIILLVSIILPMVFDQALNDLIFPIFLIMLKLCFSNANEIRRGFISRTMSE